MDNIEEKNILQIIAAVIAESLKNKNKFPSGETLKTEINTFATAHNYKKTKYSFSEISRLKETALVKEQLIDFKGIKIKGRLDKEIGMKLENAFGLEKAIIVDNNDILASNLNKNEYLGRKAAEHLQQDFYGKTVSRIPASLNEKARDFFEQQLSGKPDILTKVKQKRRKILTFSCGSSVGSAIDSLSGDFSNTTIYSSIVLFADAFEGLSPSQLVHNFSHKFGSIGVASQIPYRVLGVLDVDTPNEYFKRRSIYRSIIQPSLEKTLGSDYLMLGIGGIPRDKKFGGFSFHVEQDHREKQKQKLWSSLSKKCCGEISHWPILNKSELENEGKTIWLWDYLWEKQSSFARKWDPDEEHLYEKECGLFIDYFIKTYTLNFNKLMSFKLLHNQIIRDINALIDTHKEKDYNEELQKLTQNDNYKRIFRTDPQDLKMSNPLNILDKLNRRKVITPAGGKEKVEAIYQCLSTKQLIDVLVTDSETARNLMAMNS